MFVIQHICLKDIYMLYKLYVTYICYVILNNIQIHFKASRTYKHIHQSIFLAIYCRTTHNARTGTLVPNKSVALSASACQVSLH